MKIHRVCMSTERARVRAGRRVLSRARVHKTRYSRALDVIVCFVPPAPHECGRHRYIIVASSRVLIQSAMCACEREIHNEDESAVKIL